MVLLEQACQASPIPIDLDGSKTLNGSWETFEEPASRD